MNPFCIYACLHFSYHIMLVASFVSVEQFSHVGILVAPRKGIVHPCADSICLSLCCKCHICALSTNPAYSRATLVSECTPCICVPVVTHDITLAVLSREQAPGHLHIYWCSTRLSVTTLHRATSVGAHLCSVVHALCIRQGIG